MGNDFIDKKEYDNLLVSLDKLKKDCNYLINKWEAESIHWHDQSRRGIDEDSFYSQKSAIFVKHSEILKMCAKELKGAI